LDLCLSNCCCGVVPAQPQQIPQQINNQSNHVKPPESITAAPKAPTQASAKQNSENNSAHISNNKPPNPHQMSMLTSSMKQWPTMLHSLHQHNHANNIDSTTHCGMPLQH